MLSEQSLFRHREFRRLWIGDTISQGGTMLSQLAIPVLAVTQLNANAAQMGLLTACETAAFLVIGLPAGAWVDRWRKRQVLITNDLLRAVGFGSLPLAYAFGLLTLAQLYVVALLVGTCTVFFDVAYQSYLPALVNGEQLVDGNAKLQASQSVAQVAGPAAGGLLLRVISAPALIAADAVSYLLSAFFVGRIEVVEATRSKADRRPLRVEIAEGLMFVLRHPLLRSITACTSISNLGSGIRAALFVLLMLRTLHLDTGAVGLAFAASSAGGIVGALTAGRFAGLVGEGRAIPISAVAMAPLAAGTPIAVALAPGVPPLPIIAATGFFEISLVVIYNITQVSFRQRLCPPALLGRMNASIRFIVWGTLPLGGLLGGLLGSVFGLVQAFWVSVVVGCLATLPVVLSPLIRMRTLPMLEPKQEAESGVAP